MQRGHCFRCGQRWVLGKIEPNLGDYGQFFCGACWDEAVSGDGAGQDVEPYGQKRLKVSTSWHQPSEEEHQQQERQHWRRQGLAPGLVIPSCLSLQRVHVARNTDRSRELRIASDTLHQEFKSCGASLWLASRVLLNFLERDFFAGQADLRGLKLLELGAGCGLPGMGLAQLGADVVLTDVPELCPLLDLNVALNFSSTTDGNTPPRVAPLTWGNRSDLVNLVRSEQKFDFVIASDICYDKYSLGELFETLSLLVVPGALDAELGSGMPSGATSQSWRPWPCVLFAVSRRSCEFEDLKRFLRKVGWSMRVHKEVDLEALRGDPTSSQVALVQLIPASRGGELLASGGA
eukprot:TRINITY_DN40509_c0_g1_i1.p1 TRINITY_DN40509_c0_g1~~TRINITY_DN40509_c0_g1_i1.p1  ORF type:complete len:394 (-),score=57.58 TRINITY_DN40509_c0_g1_i1:88-1131(-)